MKSGSATPDAAYVLGLKFGSEAICDLSAGVISRDQKLQVVRLSTFRDVNVVVRNFLVLQDASNGN